MKNFFKHIPIYILTAFVLLLSVGVSIRKCIPKSGSCVVSSVKSCKKESLPCIKIKERISCCKKKVQPICEKKERSCSSKSVKLQFDFETILSQIQKVDKCKEISLFSYTSNLFTEFHTSIYRAKILSFRSAPLFNKPIITEIQVFRL
ncbi:MAG: hypothetical protein HOL74_02660 [Flavobacteriales bacterium]|jgi:hypothetical protein|nr:hypothetical protein [Flavobacteriales bacterium]